MTQKPTERNVEIVMRLPEAMLKQMLDEKRKDPCGCDICQGGMIPDDNGDYISWDAVAPVFEAIRAAYEKLKRGESDD